MKVNWGALGISLGLFFLGASMIAMGFILEKRISSLEEELRLAKADIERTAIAQAHTLSKAYAQRKTITAEDLKEGYLLADEFLKR